MTKFNLNRNLFRTLLYIYEKNAKTESNCWYNDDNLLENLEMEYTESQNREKVVNRDTKKADTTNYIQHYHDLFAIEKEY
jgi:hypothetical protein